MYLLYLDDSGSAANKNEEHFILGGFIAHEKSLYWINRRLDELAAKFSTEQHIELHASEIVRGHSEPWKSIDKSERWEILKEVLRIAQDPRNEITVLACAIEKASFPKHDPVEMAFEDLCSRFHKFLCKRYQENDKESSNGLIILDESSYETTLQKHAKNFRVSGNQWGLTTNNIQEVPLFVDSRVSRGIQLADHVAYSVFRRYEKGDLNYYNIIESVFDKDNGKIHGLCHKTHNRHCTCPYCIQRTSGYPNME